MKTAAALLALAGAAAAQTNYIRVMALRSASPIHFAQLTAHGQRLWLGGETASYCPEQVEKAGGCPAGNTTSLVYYDGSLSMGAIVPGGQQVYIEADTGAVGYTQAHSANVPQDAIRDGWSVKQNALAGGVLGELSWEKGLLACPDATGAWQIFANIDYAQFSDECLGFTAVFTNSTAPSAWQYT